MDESLSPECRSADLEVLRRQLEMGLARGELDVPLLPEVAVRVVRVGAKRSTNAAQLADLIAADPALTLYVLRVATSAAKRAVMPIASLSHAVAWLGFDEVANIAFTLALQGKLLDVPGQQATARRLWRHALASALWARRLALQLGQEAGACYLGGLIHTIGRLVTLGAAHEQARVLRIKLSGWEYECLIEDFHQDVGARVMNVWQLPDPVRHIVAHWQTPPGVATGEAIGAKAPVGVCAGGGVCAGVRAGAGGYLGALHSEAVIVNLAHTMADHTLAPPTLKQREALSVDPAFRALGFLAADAEGLFEAASAILAEIDHYLAP